MHKENFIFECFRVEFEKNYCHFRSQYPQIFQYAKFHAKLKTTYIYDKMIYLDIFGLEFEKTIVIFEFV